MNITINVVGQKLTTNYTQIVEGSQNFVKFTFNLPTEWKEINPSACFSQEGKEPIGMLLETEADGQTFFTYLPPEITEGKCELSLFGAKASENGDIIGTSNCLTLTIDKRGAIDVVESEPTESVYVQWMEKVRLDTLGVIDDAITEAKSEISEATAAANLAVENISGVVDQAEKAVFDANEAIKSVRETVDNALADIGKTNGVPVVTELPTNAKNGDLCLYSAPNSIEASDSGGRIYINWDGILNYGKEWYYSEDKNKTTGFMISDVSGNMSTLAVEYALNEDGFIVCFSMLDYYYKPPYFANTDAQYCCTDACITIKGSDLGSGNISFSLLKDDCYYKTINVDSKETASLWDFSSESVENIPMYFDIGYWSSGTYIEKSRDGVFDLVPEGVTFIYSPFRLMVYREGWTRLSSLTPLSNYIDFALPLIFA